MGAIPSSVPNKNIGIALERDSKRGAVGENAMVAQRSPIPNPMRIVTGLEIPNVPISMVSLRKSAAVAISPMIKGPNFLVTLMMIPNKSSTYMGLSIMYFINPNKNFQNSSIQIFKAIFLSNL